MTISSLARRRALARQSRLRPESRRHAARRAGRALVRSTVYRRAREHCEGCGAYLHFTDMEGSHRLAESQGGQYSVVNVLALCSSCHRTGRDAVHARPRGPALERGMRCLSTEDPAVTPVVLWDHRRVLLTAAGGYLEVA